LNGNSSSNVVKLAATMTDGAKKHDSIDISVIPEKDIKKNMVVSRYDIESGENNEGPFTTTATLSNQ
jgi:hypothetical protein